MPSATVNPAIQHVDTKTYLGQDFFLLSERFRFQLAEKLDVAGLGAIPLVGMVGGGGTNTLRTPFGEDIGFANAMTELGTEGSPVPLLDMSIGYDEISVSEHGLGASVTFSQQIYGADGIPLLSIEDLMQKLPESFVKTLRSKVCTTGASITASVGSTSAAMDVDTILDLVAAYEQTDGAEEQGPLYLMLKPIQMTELRDSARAEPAMQNSLGDFAAMQRPDGRVTDNLLGLGIIGIRTSDVTDSAGAYQGFAFTRGAIGYAVGDVGRVNVDGVPVMVMPDAGCIVLQRVDQYGQAKSELNARCWLGTATSDPTVFFQRRVLSTT